ncbi:S-adenosylmethionine decarboxylase [Candidatus Woesearchaeota archaeon]|nr:S-adenosylmethionine decarboxylase [Candidatus Woesearchaeota archaeon]
MGEEKLKNTKQWGQLTIIDLFNCDKKIITNKKLLTKFVQDLCKQINMLPYGKTLIKKFGGAKLKGYSLMQFIETSSIVLHVDENKNNVFVDVFSCKSFDVQKAKQFSQQYFMAQSSKTKTIGRG